MFEKWLLKLWTIVQWTVAGLISAYIVVACWSYAMAVLPIMWASGNIPTWMTSALLYGAIGGFIAGLVKAGFVEAVDYWNSRKNRW